MFFFGLFAVMVAAYGAIVGVRFAFAFNTPHRESMWGVAAFLVLDIAALALVYLSTGAPDSAIAMLVWVPAFPTAMALTITGHFVSKFRRSAGPVLV